MRILRPITSSTYSSTVDSLDSSSIPSLHHCHCHNPSPPIPDFRQPTCGSNPLIRQSTAYSRTAIQCNINTPLPSPLPAKTQATRLTRMARQYTHRAHTHTQKRKIPCKTCLTLAALRNRRDEARPAPTHPHPWFRNPKFESDKALSYLPCEKTHTHTHTQEVLRLVVIVVVVVAVAVQVLSFLLPFYQCS